MEVIKHQKKMRKDNGDYYLFYENGNIEVKGKFLKGVPVGTWKYYNKKGKLTGKAIYQD